MGLVKVAQRFDIAMDFFLGLAATVERVARAGVASIVRPEIDGLAQPVGEIHCQATHVAQPDSGFGGIEVSPRAVEDAADVEVPLVRATIIYGPNRLRHTGNVAGAIEHPARYQPVGAAPDITQLRVCAPRAGDDPTEVVVMRVGSDQVGINPNDRAASRGIGAIEADAGQWVQQVRSYNVDTDVAGRVEAFLGIGSREYFAEVSGVGSAQHTQLGAVGEAEARREIVTVAAEWDIRQRVDLDRPGGRLEAQPEVQRQIPRCFPSVPDEILHAPAPKASMSHADRLRNPARRSETQVGHHVTPEVGSEHHHPHMPRTLYPVELLAGGLEARHEAVIPSGSADGSGVAEKVLYPVIGDAARAAEWLQLPAHEEHRPQGCLVLNDE